MLIRIRDWIRSFRVPKERRGAHREHRKRIATNRPLQFRTVGSEGKIVGRPLAIIHLTFHDMAGHAICCRLTDEVLLRGLDANAYEDISFGWLDNHNAVTIIQPRKIEESESDTAKAA